MTREFAYEDGFHQAAHHISLLWVALSLVGLPVAVYLNGIGPMFWISLLFLLVFGTAAVVGHPTWSVRGAIRRD